MLVETSTAHDNAARRTARKATLPPQSETHPTELRKIELMILP